MDIVTAIATRVRRERFERTGRSKAYDPTHPLHDTELDDARAALAAMLEAVGEPVAWRQQCKDDPPILWFTALPHEADELGWTETPLYSLAALREEGV